MKNYFIVFTTLWVTSVKANFTLSYNSYTTKMVDSLPYYYQIPSVPDTYTPEHVAARMVDGLGFRFFWATEGLRQEDLLYEPNEEARSTRHTLDHIFDLSNIIYHATLQKPYKPDTMASKYTFEELRNKTLDHLMKASELLKSLDANLELKKMVFTRKNGTQQEFDFWYVLNGPISDALWHVGQVVSYRRSSGNPLPKGVNVLQGTKN